MKIVFFGSSKYSTIVEEKLAQVFGLSLVVTIPDQETGRKKILTPSPVKKLAIKYSIPTITTNKLTPNVIEEITMYKPDFLIVADYGLFLPQKLLDLPKYASLNVHHSLLPKFRGPAPVPFCILSGSKKTGVSIIIMSDKIDAGDILDQKEYTLKANDTTDSVLTTLNQLGGEILIPLLKDFETYYQKRKPQNEKEATITQYMTKNDGYINLDNPPKPEIIDRMIRAYYPWPGVWTSIRIRDKGLRIKLLPSPVIPSEIEGSFPFLIQIEGKKPISYKDFINGYPEVKQLFEKLQLV